MSNSAIESMYQYWPDRLWNELRLLGKDHGQLTVPDLIPLDQYHYLTTEALDEAAKILRLSEQSHVLDIGSGLGGPARYLAWKYGCQVTGVELLQNFHTAGVQLTERTNLSNRVKLHLGDFLQLEQLDLPNHSFDYWFSLLVFLHIPDRAALFANCAKVLKPGGSFYIEDFFQRQPLTQIEQVALADVVACPYLPTREQYLADLETAGFIELEFQEVTSLWQPWVAERAAKFEAQREDDKRNDDMAIINSFSRFYQVMSELFAGGNLGGVRISGKYAA